MVESRLQQRAYIKRIHSNMLSLNRLIQDLFELAKIEMQQVNFSREKIFAGKLVEDCYQKYVFDVEKSGVIFKKNSTVSSDVMILVDEGRLDQVFANLISNAMRYTKQDGVITLGCKLVYKGYAGFDIEGSSKQVCFTVADNGTGIGLEYVPHIFERFYRGKEAGTLTGEHSTL